MNARVEDPVRELAQREQIMGAFKKFGPLTLQGLKAAGVDFPGLNSRIAYYVGNGTIKVVGGTMHHSVYALTGKDLTSAEFSLNPEGQVRMSKLGRHIDLEPAEARKLLQFLTRTEDVWFPPEEVKP